jgi:hypothetical protein
MYMYVKQIFWGEILNHNGALIHLSRKRKLNILQLLELFVTNLRIKLIVKGTCGIGLRKEAHTVVILGIN